MPTPSCGASRAPPRRDRGRAGTGVDCSATRLLPPLAICSLFAAGCGATTARIELAPTIDTGGRYGFEGTFSVGIGLPLDYHGRSHHYFQARPGLGAGVDNETKKATFITHADFDYIYWAEPRLDLRAGLRLSYRGNSDAKRYGFGGRLGLLPLVLHDDSSWLVSQLAIGPELRVEHVSADPGGSRGLFSAPLVIEGNFLGAGD